MQINLSIVNPRADDQQLVHSYTGRLSAGDVIRPCIVVVGDAATPCASTTRSLITMCQSC
jgi:hypothetical protein